MQVLSYDAEKKAGITGDDSYKCNRCEVKPAEIFQINGEYLSGLLANHNSHQFLTFMRTAEK